MTRFPAISINDAFIGVVMHLSEFFSHFKIKKTNKHSGGYKDDRIVDCDEILIHKSRSAYFVAYDRLHDDMV